MLVHHQPTVVRRVLRWLHRVAIHPAANIAVGIILLITAVIECFTFLFVELGLISVGAHHGILFLAVVHLARAIPDAFKGIKFIDEGEEARVGQTESGVEA